MTNQAEQSENGAAESVGGSAERNRSRGERSTDPLYRRGQGKDDRCVRYGATVCWPWDESGGRAVHQGGYRYGRRARIEVFRRSSGLSSDGRRLYLGNARPRERYEIRPACLGKGVRIPERFFLCDGHSRRV